MAALGSYTTTEAVRGCLGVDEEDCPDVVMSDSLLDVELTHDLDSWLPAHATLFATGSATAASASEKKIKEQIQLFSQWWCAAEVAARRLLVPQIATDGKARLDRFKVDLAEAEALARSRAGLYKNALTTSQGGSAPIAGNFNLIVAGVPAADPVTESIQ